MFVFLGLLIFLGAVGFVVFKTFRFGTDEAPVFWKPTIPVLVGSLLASILVSGIVVVQAGDRAAIFNIFSGVQDTRILGEGMHYVLPGINHLTHYDIYTRTWTDNIDCLSSDGLPINFDVSIRYRLNPDKVAAVLSHVGDQKDTEEKILIPTARSKMRDVAAGFAAQEAFASKRLELQEKYRQILTSYMGSEGYLIPEQILIREVKPPVALTEKITETKVAEQDVIKQKNILEAQKQVKQQTIVKAQAEAEALRIKANAIANNAKVVTLEWINKWDGKLPMFTGNGTAFMDFRQFGVEGK